MSYWTSNTGEVGFGPDSQWAAPAPAPAPVQAASSKPSAQEIAQFFEANKANPQAITQKLNELRGQGINITPEEIAQAVGKPEEMNSYLQWAGITQGQDGGLQIAPAAQFSGAWKDFNFQDAMKQPFAEGESRASGRKINGYDLNPIFGNSRTEGQGENIQNIPGDPTEYWVTKSLDKEGGNGFNFGGGNSAIYEGAAYDRYSADGKYLGSDKYKNMGTDGFTKVMAYLSAIGAGAVAGGAITGAMATQAGLSAAEMASLVEMGIGDASLASAAAEAAGSTATMGAGGGLSFGGGEILSKAALDGTTAFGANSVAGALDISALTAATTPAAADAALTQIAKQLGYTSLTAAQLPQVLQQISNAAPDALTNATRLLPSLVGPATAVVGGLVTANAAKDAAETQAKAGQESNALLKYMYDDQKAQNKPFYDTGVKGINRLSDLMGVSGNKTAEGYGDLSRKFDMVRDYEQDPGYQFRVAEGEKALDRAAAAKGSYFSGRAAKDLNSYNSGMASQEFGSSYGRWERGQTDQFNRLAALSGVGQTAAAANQSAGTNYGNQASANITGAGNATAAGKVAGANALTGAVTQGVSMYQNNELLNRILSSRGY